MDELPARADVVVAGAGFAGAATAWFLARAGRSVVLLERDSAPGRHASGRNAAICRQLDDDDAVTRLAMRGAALLRSPPRGLEGPFLAPRGGLLIARTVGRLDALAAAAARAGLGYARVGPDEVAARWPRLGGATWAGAIAVPDDGVIAIGPLLEALIGGARAAGGRLALGAALEGVAPTRDALVVTSARGAIETRCLVVATGPWAGEVAGRVGAEPPRLAIRRRHLFETAPVDDVDRAAPVAWIEDAEGFYVRPHAGGLLLSGCDDVPATPGEPEIDPAARAALEAKLARLAPRLAEVPILRVRACLRTFVAGGRPRIGWTAGADRVLLVVGLGGHGATSALAVGEAAAAAIAARLR